MLAGFCDWKHAVEMGKGLNKHAALKEHLLCEAMWKDKESRASMGKEISTLVNAEQLQRNRYYLSSIVDVIEFLTVNHLPLRGDHDAFDSMFEAGCGFFVNV